jgi:hypothetical protein
MATEVSERQENTGGTKSLVNLDFPLHYAKKTHKLVTKKGASFPGPNEIYKPTSILWMVLNFLHFTKFFSLRRKS